MRYRKERQNKLPEERSIDVRLEVENLPIETFDLTQFCTSEHAQLVAVTSCCFQVDYAYGQVLNDRAWLGPWSG